MKKTLIISTILVAAILIIVSCNKENETVIDNTSVASKDNSTSENLFTDIKKVVEEAADDQGQSSKAAYSFGACATVTINPAWIDPTWPKVMEIDFGTANCTGAYGVNRRGKLVVTLTDVYRNTGSILTIQPQDYYINDIKVEGTKTITNNGYNANNNLEFTVDVVNGKITYTNNKITTWASTRTNEWVEGDSTTLASHGLPGICDDVYLINGSANGTDRNGRSFTVAITSPLRKEVCCRWLVSGVLEVTPNGLSTRIMDFGTGACDNIATLTINNNTINVPMF